MTTYYPPGKLSRFAAIVSFPKTMRPGDPLPILVHFHGTTSLDLTAPFDYQTQIDGLRSRSHKTLFDELFIVVHPLRPRRTGSDTYPEYMHDSQSFTKESVLPEFASRTADPLFARPDEHVAELIAGAAREAWMRGVRAQDRVVVVGGSAGAMAANRFALLHPECVCASALISGGVYSYPLREFDGVELTYPFGLAGVLNPPATETIAKIPHLVLVGADDRNDPLLYDLHGSEHLADQLNALIGTDPVDRARRFVACLRGLGCDATCETVPGAGHILDREAVHQTILRWLGGRV